MDPELTPLACKVVPNLEYQTLHLSHLRSPRHLSAALDFLSRMLRARTTFFSYMPTDDVPGQEYMMDDLLHAVAYGGRGLGRRSVPTRQRLREVLNGEFRSFGLVESWRREWWIQHGDRMTVAGSGMKHEDLERETKKALGWVGGEDLTFEPPRTVKEGIAPWIVKIKAWLYPPTPPVIFEPAGFKAMSKAPSVYDGGMVVLEDGGGAGFLEGGTEIRIAFEGLPEEDDDVASTLWTPSCDAWRTLTPVLLPLRTACPRGHLHYSRRQAKLGERSVATAHHTHPSRATETLFHCGLYRKRARIRPAVQIVAERPQCQLGRFER